MNVLKTGRVFLQLIKRNSPIILSVAAGVGLAALYILTIKETEEAVHEIDEAPEEEVHSFKMAKKTAKIMAPSFVVFVLTMFCIVQSCMISQHRIRDLTQYSAMLAATFNQYRIKNRELLGPDGPENNDQIIMTQIACDKTEKMECPNNSDDRPLCLMNGYDNYFRVPNLIDIYAAFSRANEYMDTGYGSVELCKWMKWANAIEYDENDRPKGMNPRYLHYGWDTYDLTMTEAVSGVYPSISRIEEESGLVIYFIDVPAPKPLDVI